jgi:hypothetical protein
MMLRRTLEFSARVSFRGPLQDRKPLETCHTMYHHFPLLAQSLNLVMHMYLSRCIQAREEGDVVCPINVDDIPEPERPRQHTLSLPSGGCDNDAHVCNAVEPVDPSLFYPQPRTVHVNKKTEKISPFPLAQHHLLATPPSVDQK